MLPYGNVTLDSVLNALWLLLGLIALATTLRLAVRKNTGLGRRRTWQSCAVVALIAATLFPVISATDDLLRIESIRRQHQARNTGDRRPAQKNASDNLIRLYEAMDMPLIAETAEVLLSLLFVCLLTALLQNGIERSNPSAIGRSPPAFTCS